MHCLLYTSDVSMSGLQADGSFNYDYNFAYVRDIVQAADLAVDVYKRQGIGAFE